MEINLTRMTMSEAKKYIGRVAFIGERQPYPTIKNVQGKDEGKFSLQLNRYGTNHDTFYPNEPIHGMDVIIKIED